MMHRIPMDMGNMLWGKIQETHHREKRHSNARDVEDPIYVEFVHLGKGM